MFLDFSMGFFGYNQQSSNHHDEDRQHTPSIPSENQEKIDPENKTDPTRFRPRS